jgi:hypothetical protein
MNVLHLIRHPKVRYCVHKRPQSIPILNHYSLITQSFEAVLCELFIVPLNTPYMNIWVNKKEKLSCCMLNRYGGGGSWGYCCTHYRPLSFKVSATSQLLYPYTRYPLRRRLDVSGKSRPTGVRTPQPIASRYADYTTPAPIQVNKETKNTVILSTKNVFLIL